MIRLSRQVRFAVNATADGQSAHKPTNGHGGYPSLTGLGYFFTLDVTLVGELHPQSQYLRNIKEIDEVVRSRGIPLVDAAVREGAFGAGGHVLSQLYVALAEAWPGSVLQSLRLGLSPFLSLSIERSELPMIRLSQKFEFSATHRLHNPLLSDADNRSTFGKCNNPLGHGHNYEVQVTVAAEPDGTGKVVDVVGLERVVGQHVIEKLDHKNLNAEVPEFRETIPSVENIARVIFDMLKSHTPARLMSVTVWETPKTWCEYSEDNSEL